MAEKKEEKKEEGKGGEAAAEAVAPKKSKKKLFIIVGAVLVLILGAGVPMFLMGGGEKEGEEGADAHHEEHTEKHLSTAALDTFIVNLSETGAFLKVKMLLEFDEAPLKKAEEELAKHGAGGGEGGGHGGGGASGLPGYLGHREPMIRDAIIRVLATKKSTEVLSSDGKEHLKEQIIEAVNEAVSLEEAPVQQVYFTEFIIQ